jgi:NAD(P)-dependent dehydrogenase (short-subunit alcohol dehydrogenase family)
MALRIVLTGASRGLGRAMAEGFAALGHTVIGCATSQKSVDGLASQFGTPHRFDVVDVRRWEQVERWAKDVLGQGVPDLLINNAAVMGPVGRLWNASVEEFDAMVDANIKGVFYTLRAFLPAMVAQRRGVIVNFSSGWGRSTAPDVAPYCATKYAIEGLTQALAQELPEGMAAVPLNPGVINTDMLQTAFGDGAGDYLEPGEWAKKAVPYILSLGSKDNGRQRTVPS